MRIYYKDGLSFKCVFPHHLSLKIPHIQDIYFLVTIRNQNSGFCQFRCKKSIQVALSEQFCLGFLQMVPHFRLLSLHFAQNYFQRWVLFTKNRYFFYLSYHHLVAILDLNIQASQLQKLFVLLLVFLKIPWHILVFRCLLFDWCKQKCLFED